MRQLAVVGGKPIVGPIKPLNTISPHTADAVSYFMRAVADGAATLSGYLAGQEHGGSAVQRLEMLWCEEFKVKHAIACNSCTSAILTALSTVVPGSEVVIPTMGMSAAAATAKLLGLNIIFADVDDYFTIISQGRPEAVTLGVNLFGMPINYEAVHRDTILIEDNAQAPWASYKAKFSGTFGNIGCWSFNVHKPLNAGEGGMITTDDPMLAIAMRRFINHGEVSGWSVGLNLRMTELTAIIAMAQMAIAKTVVTSRELIASELNTMIGEDTDFVLPQLRPECSSSWYCYPLRINRDKRDWAVKALRAEGVPCSAGYTLMHKLPAFLSTDQRLHNAEVMNDQLALIELCSIDPDNDQIMKMAQAIQEIGRYRP